MSTFAPAAGITMVVDGVEHLVGSRCTCGVHTFPAQGTCARCGGEMSPVPLPTAGTVWSWTVQRYAPKPPYRGPSPFQPYAIAYVDLGPLRVESPLAGRPIDGWTIGDRVELAVHHDDEHTPFTFVPASGLDHQEPAS